MSAAVEKALVSVLLLAVIVPVFFGTAAITATREPVAWLVTRWDARIPFVPAAVWPYISWYFAPWLLLMAPRRDFRRVAGAIALAFATCTIGFVFLPACMERPAIQGGTFSESALLLLYRHDPPWNIFPSFHAALCGILWRPVFGGRLWRTIMPAWMLTICAACVLTKQHQILDVVAGALVGCGALAVATGVFNRWDRSRADAGRPTQAILNTLNEQRS